MQDAEVENAAPVGVVPGARERRTNVKASPLALPKAPAGLVHSRVCVHVHEHGQLTDSTNWEAQGRRD